MDLRPLRDELDGVPQNPVPRNHVRNIAFRVKRGLDFLGHSKPERARWLRQINPYPKPWEHAEFRTEDGVQIAGWYGPAKADWGLVLVPGMFSTKDDTAHKRRAIRIWRKWKIPVMVIDMRAFGESTGIATGGWKEALDIHAAAKELAARAGVQRVGVLAESLGGAAAINAAAHDAASGSELLHGGVLTYSAFVDTKDAVEYISAEPPKEHPFYIRWRGFGSLLSKRSDGHYHSFAAYMEDAAKVHGIDLEELYRLANPKWKVHMIHAPMLCIHASDDPVVPIRHLRRMSRYAIDVPNIATLTVPWGEHTGFEPMDSRWFWYVTRRFFETANHTSLPNVEPEP
ncbi:MAG: hypothetical protein ACPHK8_06855 [Thermoplasmatota archaeon]